MVDAVPSKPKFLTAFFSNVSDAYEDGGWKAIVPWWLLLGLAAGFAAAWFMPVAFWSDEKWDVATTVFTGFLAFDGLLLALGWGAFSKIYEILTNTRIAAFLRRNDLLADHLFFVDAVHGILVTSAITSGGALVACLMALPLWADQAIMTVVIGFSFWSLTKALGAIQMMNGLIWDLAHTEEDDRGRLRPVETGKSRP